MPRTPEYDRAEVVDKAMAVFWERGYGQTSIGDLVDATGLKPGSLYAAFGSKKGVFLEVLDEYNRAFLVNVRSMARAEGSKIAAVRGILDDIVDKSVRGDDRRGCLSVNALLEMSQHEPDIAARLEGHNQGVRDAFATLIRAAQDGREIPADKDADALAAFLVNNIWGMRVSCRGCLDRGGLTAIVEAVMASLESA